jgi:UDP-N-acetylglucosamine diphosphorylase/glucosamine-1-phosphate N-acetyltransferase
LKKELSVIILAAGKGTRMKSDLAKVLHPALGRPLIHWVIDQAKDAGSTYTVAVVGHQRESVIASCADKNVDFAIQAEQKGTGHAVQMCKELFAKKSGQVLVLSGDVPLLRAQTIKDLGRVHLESGNIATVLSANFTDPAAYGRMIRDSNGQVQKIVEAKDASAEELQVREINSGIYLFDVKLLFEYIQRLDSNNAQGELYLTDVVRFLVEDNHKVGAMIGDDEDEIMGVNTIEQLAEVESVLKSRSC